MEMSFAAAAAAAFLLLPIPLPAFPLLGASRRLGHCQRPLRTCLAASCLDSLRAKPRSPQSSESQPSHHCLSQALLLLPAAVGRMSGRLKKKLPGEVQRPGSPQQPVPMSGRELERRNRRNRCCLMQLQLKEHWIRQNPRGQSRLRLSQGEQPLPQLELPKWPEHRRHHRRSRRRRRGATTCPHRRRHRTHRWKEEVRRRTLAPCCQAPPS
mmetsp:Transcript_14902/g.32854  ORF Transcript_14902/g.32854 Transcript_14902/m.32854 type:complete len:211 (-) Transcript_14902:913-1545(-)